MGGGVRVGSLFTGTGMLDEGFRMVVPSARHVFVADVCQVKQDGTAGHKSPHSAPCTILAHRFPDVPNLGDVSGIDWTPWRGKVDVLSGGFPCQDVSTAGARQGLREGTRSGLWSEVARAIRELQPRMVLLENVIGLLSAETDSDVEPCSWGRNAP